MRCSLLGHSYGSDEEDRTTNDDADGGDIEVRQQVRVCDRCGHEDVVSENTSVRVVEDEEESESAAEELAQSGDDESEPIESDGTAPVSRDLNHGYDLGTDDAVLVSGSNDAPEEADSTPEPSSETGGYDDANENGVAIIESGLSDTDTDNESVEPEPSENPLDAEEGAIDTGAHATILTSDPAPTPSETDSPSTEESDEEDVDTSEDDDVATGGDHAVVWSGNTSSSDATRSRRESDSEPTADTEDVQSPPDARQERESPVERRRRRQEKRNRVTSQSDGRELVCSNCSYSEHQYIVNLVAGDACPKCRMAFLDWNDSDSE